jgi:hypothetical protein
MLCTLCARIVPFVILSLGKVKKSSLLCKACYFKYLFYSKMFQDFSFIPAVLYLGWPTSRKQLLLWQVYRCQCRMGYGSVNSHLLYGKWVHSITYANHAWLVRATAQKAGFLFMEDAFVSEPSQRRRVIITVSYMYAVIESSSHAYIIWHSPVSDAGNDLQRP